MSARNRSTVDTGYLTKLATTGLPVRAYTVCLGATASEDRKANARKNPVAKKISLPTTNVPLLRTGPRRIARAAGSIVLIEQVRHDGTQNCNNDQDESDESAERKYLSAISPVFGARRFHRENSTPQPSARVVSKQDSITHVPTRAKYSAVVPLPRNAPMTPAARKTFAGASTKFFA